MTHNAVEQWFGDRFCELAKELQDLHRNGGTLNGQVDITLGTGIAGVIGKRLATKLNIPPPGMHNFSVSIEHKDNTLRWSRSFGANNTLVSLFKAIGNIYDGHWIETTQRLQIHLNVDIIDGGWHWRCLGYRILGINLPRWLFPKTTAYKTIENGQYRFYVGFSLPLIGQLLSYSGLLKMDTSL